MAKLTVRITLACALVGVVVSAVVAAPPFPAGAGNEKGDLSCTKGCRLETESILNCTCSASNDRGLVYSTVVSIATGDLSAGMCRTGDSRLDHQHRGSKSIEVADYCKAACADVFSRPDVIDKLSGFTLIGDKPPGEMRFAAIYKNFETYYREVCTVDECTPDVPTTCWGAYAAEPDGKTWTPYIVADCPDGSKCVPPTSTTERPAYGWAYTCIGATAKDCPTTLPGRSIAGTGGSTYGGDTYAN
jgi:hypothetical protein